MVRLGSAVYDFISFQSYHICDLELALVLTNALCIAHQLIIVLIVCLLRFFSRTNIIYKFARLPAYGIMGGISDRSERFVSDTNLLDRHFERKQSRIALVVINDNMNFQDHNYHLLIL